jgi:hypothetical protein
MSSAGFESAIPAIDRLQIFSFDCRATSKPLTFTPPNSLFSNFSCYNDNLEKYSKLLRMDALVLTSQIKVNLIFLVFSSSKFED